MRGRGGWGGVGGEDGERGRVGRWGGGHESSNIPSLSFTDPTCQIW